MPKIEGVKLAERKPFFEGLEGVITGAEIVKTAIQGYYGVRVKITTDDGEEYAEMLWVRPEVGSKSKLGAFMSALGDNTDLWLGCRVVITRWKERNREVSVISRPKPQKKEK